MGYNDFEILFEENRPYKGPSFSKHTVDFACLQGAIIQWAYTHSWYCLSTSVSHTVSLLSTATHLPASCSFLRLSTSSCRSVQENYKSGTLWCPSDSIASSLEWWITECLAPFRLSYSRERTPATLSFLIWRQYLFVFFAWQSIFKVSRTTCLI